MLCHYRRDQANVCARPILSKAKTRGGTGRHAISNELALKYKYRECLSRTISSTSRARVRRTITKPNVLCVDERNKSQFAEGIFTTKKQVFEFNRLVVDLQTFFVELPLQTKIPGSVLYDEKTDVYHFKATFYCRLLVVVICFSLF